MQRTQLEICGLGKACLHRAMATQANLAVAAVGDSIDRLVDGQDRPSTTALTAMATCLLLHGGPAPRVVSGRSSLQVSGFVFTARIACGLCRPSAVVAWPKYHRIACPCSCVQLNARRRAPALTRSTSKDADEGATDTGTPTMPTPPADVPVRPLSTFDEYGGYEAGVLWCVCHYLACVVLKGFFWPLDGRRPLPPFMEPRR